MCSRTVGLYLSESHTNMSWSYFAQKSNEEGEGGGIICCKTKHFVLTFSWAHFPPKIHHDISLFSLFVIVLS